MEQDMEYEDGMDLTRKYLNKKTSAQLVDILIPLIEKAIKINEFWVEYNDGDPIGKAFDECNEANAELWSDVRDLHYDFGKPK